MSRPGTAPLNTLPAFFATHPPPPPPRRTSCYRLHSALPIATTIIDGSLRKSKGHQLERSHMHISIRRPIARSKLVLSCTPTATSTKPVRASGSLVVLFIYSSFGLRAYRESVAVLAVAAFLGLRDDLVLGRCTLATLELPLAPSDGVKSSVPTGPSLVHLGAHGPRPARVYVESGSALLVARRLGQVLGHQANSCAGSVYRVAVKKKSQAIYDAAPRLCGQPHVPAGLLISASRDVGVVNGVSEPKAYLAGSCLITASALKEGTAMRRRRQYMPTHAAPL